MCSIITANDRYRNDANYRKFVLSHTLPSDPNEAILNTVPLMTDAGTYPLVVDSKSIFTYVKNYILHGDVTIDYFSQTYLVTATRG